MKEYDLIVIGAGPGGYEAAFEAADLGMKTALIEKEELGGTCLNHGCIPTKSLLHSAELFRSLKEAEQFGITADEVGYDPLRMQERKNEVILQLRHGIETTAKKKKIDIFRGIGTVCPDNIVRVTYPDAQTEQIRAPRILLASGSRPSLPPIPGIDLPGIVTSDELLECTEKIGSLLIVGGGVIGVEFASLYRSLGTEVTVVEALPQLLPNLDKEIAQSLKMLFKKRGITVHTGVRIEAFRQDKEGKLLAVCTEGTKELTVTADTILIAAGRRPCTDGLFEEGLSPLTDRGRILVNERFETSLPGIFAIGDVTGGTMLAHTASAAGRNAVRYMARKEEFSDLRFIPSCIYTQPEIACVGMTADQAKEAGIAADSRKALMSANGKSVLSGSERGYIRVVFEKESGRLLGAQMMCDRATDMISEFTEALSAGLTVTDLLRVIRPHPTFSEAITDALKG